MSHSVPVAIVGAGNMGGGMLARLRQLGWALAVHDTDGAAQQRAVSLGALSCASAKDAALQLDDIGVLLVVVVDAAQTEVVLWGGDGAAQAMKPGQTVMLCPTLGPATVENQALRLAQLGIDCIDAPMSGGPARARDGSMSLMVACAEPVWQRNRALLDALSQRVFRVGTRVGDGARTKLVNNLLAAVNLAGASEAMVLAERLGLDPAGTLSVIEASSGQSWIGSDRMRRALVGDFEPRAHVSLLAKDTVLAVQAAQEAAYDPVLGRLARDLFDQALQQGWAALDDSALVQWMRER